MNRRGLVWTSLVLLLAAVWFGFKLATPDAVDALASVTVNPAQTTKSQIKPPARDYEPSVTARMPERIPEPKPGQKSGNEMLEEWLSSSTDSDRVGLTIMQNFFQLPEKDHVTAMRQLVNLVRDFNISGLERILIDPRTSLPAKEMLYEDIKIRPDAVKFPIFLKLMQHPEHPSSQNAREILGRVLNGDWGTDYARWEREIERVLGQ